MWLLSSAKTQCPADWPVSARSPAPNASPRWRRRFGKPRRWARRSYVFVDHLRIAHFVLLSVSVLDITNRAVGLAHVVGNAFIAFGTDANRPFDRRVFADLR